MECYGRSENARVLDPGSWDGSRGYPLAPAARGVRPSASASIHLDGWFSPFAAGSWTLSLVRGSVHLHWKRNASAHRCAGGTGQRGALSMGSQSDVYCCPFSDNRRSHPLSLVPDCRIWYAGSSGGSYVSGLGRGTLFAYPVRCMVCNRSVYGSVMAS